MDGINIDYPAHSDRKERTLKTTFNGIDMTFALDAAESLTELANGASTAPLGTWTSVDYTIATLNNKTGQYDEEMGRSTEYSITFSEPQSYTLLQIKTDRFQSLALLGGLVTMVGLILAFYLLPAKVWAVESEDRTWTVYGRSRKGGALFREAFEEALQSQTKGETL